MPLGWVFISLPLIRYESRALANTSLNRGLTICEARSGLEQFIILVNTPV